VALLGRRKSEAGKKKRTEERTKKEKKKSKVKLKTEQIEKTWTRKTGEEKIKKIANSEAKVRKGTWSQRQNIYIDSVQ
jgi:hypothetical protein